MGVRLGKQVKRLETRAQLAADAERESCGYVISYSPDNVKVDPSTLAPGQHVAMDVHEGSANGTMRRVERVSSDPDDLGYVYNLAGDMIGRIIEQDGVFFSYCIHSGCCDPWPDGPDPRGMHDGGLVEDEPKV